MTTPTEPRPILVVEDEALVAMLLEDLVAKLGYETIGPVATIAAALEALQAREGEPPAAALLDLNLGGEKAWPVAEALAERAVPFAFVTGYDETGIPEPWRERPLLEKPFRQADLERVLAGLLATADGG